MQLAISKIGNENPFENSIEPMKEMAAYEALWFNREISFKKLAAFFAKNPYKRPSDLVDNLEEIENASQKLIQILKKDFRSNKPNLLINSTYDYPLRLRDAKEPIEMVYYQGDIDLLNTPSVAIVGTRKPSEEGLRRAKKLVSLLVKDDYTIISGLAEGIDTCAHQTTMELKGRTIAVIGTPLNEYYPKVNKAIQEKIAKEHLLISQVPFIRYSQQNIKGNRLFFPERNKLMSAVSEATVIIEAGDTSGTLIQAQAALFQGRKLFILNNCFENPNITWPKKYEALGAIRVYDYQDIINSLSCAKG